MRAKCYHRDFITEIKIFSKDCSRAGIFIPLHCTECNQDFRDITRNVSGNDILQSTHRKNIISRFPLHFMFWIWKFLDYLWQSVRGYSLSWDWLGI